MPFEIHNQNGLVWLTSPLLEGVAHGFSTRQGGVSAAPWDSLNLGPTRGDDPAAVEENYRRFCGAVGVAPARMVTAAVPVADRRTPVSVKTRTPIPKEQIFPCMKQLSALVLKAPVRMGDVVLPDVCGTGVDVIATKTVE